MHFIWLEFLLYYLLQFDKGVQPQTWKLFQKGISKDYFGVLC